MNAGDGSKRTVRPFAPTLLSELDFREYKSEFEAVFVDESITNIALSGPFGAGKTSVMSTWENSEEGKKHKYLHLSLANFKGIGLFRSKENSEEHAGGETQADIERMLLNQLVHKVGYWRAPKSRFKTTVGGWRGFLLPIAIVVFFAGIMVLGFAEFDWYQKRIAEGVSVSCSSLLVPWLFLLVPTGILLAVASPFKGLVKRINLGGNEIEIFDEKSSAFNRYMDDILYLFISSGCDVVVIEDLDRFEKLAVFEGLREINALLNSKGGRRRPIRFFYLVRDDMLASGDRTKFFDLIIPVIPFMDRSNAADILVPELSDVGINVGLPFANELSLYLNDPRIMKDIVNNARHIKAALFDKEGELLKDDDPERIVAMSVYRALFPADYADLQIGKGCVKYYLDKKTELIDARRDEIKREIGELQEKLEMIRIQGKYNADEVALLYLTDWYDDIERNRSGGGYNSRSLKSLSPSDRVKAIDDNQGMRARFEELVLSQVEKDSEFAQRHEEARLAPERYSRACIERMSDLRRESVDLSRSSFSGLIGSLGRERREAFFAPPSEDNCPIAQKESYDRIVQTRGCADFGLIEFLLCSGYINDSYERYISRFHPTSVSSADREVLRQIVQHSTTDPLYSFDKPNASALKLSVDRFAQKNVRIFSLCHELLNNDDLADRRSRLLEAVIEDQDYRFVFLYAASNYGDARSLRLLEKCLPGVLAKSIDIFSNEANDARCICQKVLMEVSTLLEEGALRESIQRFSSSDPLFLHPEISIDSSIIERLKAIGYSAEGLEIDGSDTETLVGVYNSGLFEPDAALVLQLVKFCHRGCESVEGTQLSNSLAANTDWPARNKVNDHPVDYLQSAITEFGVLADTEDTISWLMNKCEVLERDDLVRSYASSLKGTPIENLNVIDDSHAMEVLVTENKVARTGRNIFTLYAANNNTVTEPVVSLINLGDVPDDLTFEVERGMVDSSDFLLDLGMSELVSADKFYNVVSGYGSVYDDLAVEDLPLDRARSLASTGSVVVTRENLSLYSKCYHDALVDLASSDIDEYVKLVFDEGVPDCAFDANVTLCLLRMDLALPSLLRLVGGFKSPQRVDLDCFPEEVNAAIIRHCFSREDLHVLGKAYENALTTDLKGAIECQCFDCLDDVINEVIALPVNLRLSLLSGFDIDDRRKILFVSVGCESYSEADYLKLFSAAKMNNYLRALRGTGRYLVERGEGVEVLLVDMKNKGLISSFDEDGDGRYRINAKRKKQSGN